MPLLPSANIPYTYSFFVIYDIIHCLVGDTNQRWNDARPHLGLLFITHTLCRLTIALLEAGRGTKIKRIERKTEVVQHLAARPTLPLLLEVVKLVRVLVESPIVLHAKSGSEVNVRKETM